MEAYTPLQWLLIFFVYSVLGWVWESCYVSVKSKRWVNRGFLHGPWLPIYGSGAVVVLLVTLPARGRPALIFLLGMIGATVLEYVTGESMEKFFHMRYWDYSDKPAERQRAHLPGGIHRLGRVFPGPAVRPASAGGGPGPLAASAGRPGPGPVSDRRVRGGYHLVGAEGPGHQAPAGQPERDQPPPGHGPGKAAGRRQRAGTGPGRAKLPDPKQALQRAAADGESKKAYLLHKLQERRDSTNGLLDRLNEKNRAALAQVSARLAAVGDDRKERKRLENLRTFLLGVRDSLAKTQQEVYARRDKDYQRAVDLLYRNPTATSRQHAGAFRLLKSLKKERKTKS